MLNRNTIENAVALARQLVEAGIVLTPVDGTPLAELVSAADPIRLAPTDASTAPLQTAGLNRYEFENATQFADAVFCATANYEQDSQHSLKIRAMGDDLSPIVVSHLSFARNTVLPIVKKTEEALGNYINMTALPPASANFRVVKAKFPGILLDESFLAMGIETYKDVRLQGSEKFTSNFIIPPENYKELLAQVTNLGNDRLNGLMSAWLNTAKFNLIERVFLATFATGVNTRATEDSCGNPAPDYYDITSDYYFAPYGAKYDRPYASMDLALATYLIATYLENNPMATNKNLDLGAYKREMIQIRMLAGGYLWSQAKRIMLQIETNILVSEYSGLNKTVVVHAPIYDAFLAEGGTPDMLLGALVSNKVIYDKSAVLEAKDALLTNWGNFVLLHDKAARDSLKEMFVVFIRNYMLGQVKSELTESEKGQGPGHVENVMQNVEAELAHFAHRITDDIPHLALHLVAKARFYFTSSYELLNEMVMSAKENDSIAPREAAGQATMTYLIDYLLAQTRPTTTAATVK